jgi:hypothetical protein
MTHARRSESGSAGARNVRTPADWNAQTSPAKKSCSPIGTHPAKPSNVHRPGNYVHRHRGSPQTHSQANFTVSCAVLEGSGSGDSRLVASPYSDVSAFCDENRRARSSRQRRIRPNEREYIGPRGHQGRRCLDRGDRRDSRAPRPPLRPPHSLRGAASQPPPRPSDKPRGPCQVRKS